MRSLGDAPDPVLLLAAGASKRVGSAKALIEIEGRPWIIHQVDRLAKIGINDITIVLGYHGAAIEEVLKQYGKNDLKPRIQINLAWNQSPALGSFSSLQVGVKFSFAKFSFGFYVLPVDVPVPLFETWKILTEASRHKSNPFVIVPTFENKGGHPVWLNREFAQNLTQLSPSQESSRLDLQIKMLEPLQVQRVPVTCPEILMNFNSMDQYLNWKP